MPISSRIYFSGEGSGAVYALEGSVAYSGSVVQWLRDNLGFISSAQECEALARSVPDNGGEICCCSDLFAMLSAHSLHLLSLHSCDFSLLLLLTGVYFVPAFAGLFAPYWRSDARGVITGLTAFNTKVSDLFNNISLGYCLFSHSSFTHFSLRNLIIAFFFSPFLSYRPTSCGRPWRRAPSRRWRCPTRCS